MGTNYYHHTEKCLACGNYEEKHIGKSSAGWTFSFRGHTNIRTYKDWIEVLTEGEIWDEYGNKITLRKFREIVENRGKNLWNHAKKYPDGCWLDSEGHGFSDSEFS